MQADFVGGKRNTVRKTVRKGGAVPPQLRDWHSFLKQYRAKVGENVPFKDVMKMASKAYQAQKRKFDKSLGYGMQVAGMQVAGMDVAGGIEVAGKRRAVRKPAPKKRGAGIFSTIGKVANLVGDVTGLGKPKRKPAPKRKKGGSWLDWLPEE